MKNSLVLLSVWLGIASAFGAGTTNDADELRRLGDQVRQGEALERELRAGLQQKVDGIRADGSLSTADRQRKINDAYLDYRTKSQDLTVKYRKPAQDRLIQEANAGNFGKGAVKETAGSKIGEAGHRGWTGDTDAGGDVRPVDRLVKTARAMGLKVNESPGYVNIEGLDLTAHKQGSMGRPGSEAHYVQIAVDAKSHETYVSAAMRQGQAGKNLVETNDHIKKALGGLNVSPEQLAGNPEKLQVMVKGTGKAIESSGLTEAKIAAILRQRGIEKTPEAFVRDLKTLKGGASLTPEAAGLDSKQLAKMQQACGDILVEARSTAERQFKVEAAKIQERIRVLKENGMNRQAAAVQEELFDSYVRANATNKANAAQMDRLEAQTLKRPGAAEAAAARNAKINRAIGVIGVGMSIFQNYNAEAEQAAKEGRSVSLTKVGAKTALDLIGVTGTIDQAKAVHDELTVKNREYVDSQLDELDRAGYDLAKVSNARLLIITAKSTIRTATMGTYQTAKGAPVVGDIIGGIENTVAIGTSGYDAIHAQIEKNRILEENRIQQAATLSTALKYARESTAFLRDLSAQFNTNAAMMASYAGMLRSYDQLATLRMQWQNNLRSCEALGGRAKELKTEAGRLKNLNPASLENIFDAIRREADKEVAAVDDLLRRKEAGKAAPEVYRREAEAIRSAFGINEEKLSDRLDEVDSLRDLAQSRWLLQAGDTYRQDIARSGNDVATMAKAAALAATQYRRLAAEQETIDKVFRSTREKLFRGIDYFYEKKVKPGSEDANQLEKTKSIAEAITPPRPADPAEIRRTSEMLDKLAAIGRDLMAIKAPQPVAGGIDEKDVQLAATGYEKIQPGLLRAIAAVEAARERIGALRLKDSMATVTVNVLDRDSGDQINGAMVNLTGGAAAVNGVSTSGAARLEEIGEGSYRLVVTADGYESYSVQAVVKPAEKPDHHITVKLARTAAAPTMAEEERKEDAAIRAQAAKIVDEDIKKAAKVIDAVISLARQGSLLSRNNLIAGRGTSLMSPLADYCGLKNGGRIINLIMLGRNNVVVEQFNAKAAQLGLAGLVEVMARNLSEARVGFSESTATAMVLGRDAAGIPGAGVLKTVADFDRQFRSSLPLCLSNIRWFKAYREWQDRRRQKIAATAMPIPNGGLAALSKELDAFFDSPEAGKIFTNRAEFMAANPHIIEDYRAKYIQEKILPGLLAWATAQRQQAEKELTVVLKTFASNVAAASVQVRGKVTVRPETFPCMVSFQNGKLQETKKISGDYLFQFPLKQLDNDYLTVSVKLVYPDSRLYWWEGGRNSQNFSFYAENLSTTATIRVAGFSVEIAFEPFSFSVWKRPNTDLPADTMVKMPVLPLNRNQEFATAAAAVLTACRAGTVPLELGEYRLASINAETRGAANNFNQYYWFMIKCLKHNRDLETKALRQQNVPYDRISAVDKACAAKVDQLEKELRRVEKETDQLVRNNYAGISALQTAVNSSSSQLSRSGGELEKRTRALNEQYSREKYALDKSVGEWMGLLYQVIRDRNADGSFDYVNPEALSPYFDERLKKFPDQANTVMTQVGRLSGAAAQYRECGRELRNLSGQLTALRLKSKGKFFYEDDLLVPRGPSGYNPVYTLENLERDATWFDVCAGVDFKANFAANSARLDRYLGKRGTAMAGFEQMLAKAEQLADGLPSQSEVAAVEAKFQPLSARIEAYANAIRRAVMLKTKVGKLPDGVLDRKGSDQQFVDDTLRELRDLLNRHREVVADLLPESAKASSRLKELQELLWHKIKPAELSPEQSKRYTAVNQKCIPLYSARSSLYLFGVMPIFESVEKMGKTPDERVKALIAANDAVTKLLQEKSRNAGAVGSVEAANTLINDANDWFGRMPDVPTLENLKLRGTLFQSVCRSGLYAAVRQAEKLPPAPASVVINSRSYPYDGSTIVFAYKQLPALSAQMVKNYEKTPWQGKFAKSLMIKMPKTGDNSIEFSMDGRSYNKWYDPKVPYEMPVGRDYLPLAMTLYLRNAAPDGKVSSVGREPGLTLVILP